MDSLTSQNKLLLAENLFEKVTYSTHYTHSLHDQRFASGTQEKGVDTARKVKLDSGRLLRLLLRGLEVWHRTCKTSRVMACAQNVQD